MKYTSFYHLWIKEVRAMRIGHPVTKRTDSHQTYANTFIIMKNKNISKSLRIPEGSRRDKK